MIEIYHQYLYVSQNLNLFFIYRKIRGLTLFLEGIITENISQSELKELAKEFYVEMVKGVADIERGIIALGGEWHADANQVLIEDDSKQNNLWGKGRRKRNDI